MISFIKSAKSLNDFPSTEKEIVFVGRSNVGKSSLINAIYNQKLAYVGKTPGKTRLINFFNINDQYTAVDVPGYGFANRSQQEFLDFNEMMDDYFSRKKKIKLVILIVDARIGLTQDDVDMKDYLLDKRLKTLIVANKVDKLSNNELMNVKHKVFQNEKLVLYASAEKKKGIKEIQNYIQSVLS